MGPTIEHEIAYRYRRGITRSGDAAKLADLYLAETSDAPEWIRLVSSNGSLPPDEERRMVAHLLDAMADLEEECPF